MVWAAIWSEGRPQSIAYPFARTAALHHEFEAITLWLEMQMPAPTRRPLRIWRGAGEGEDRLALFLMPDGALQLSHGDVGLSTPPGFLSAGHVMVLRLVVCARGRSDVMDVSNATTGARHRMRAGMVSRARLGDLWPAEHGYLRLATVAAIATSAVPATDLPGLGVGTRVLTEDGPIPVERLSTGDLVIGRDGGAYPVRWIEARDRLCLGRAAPILMRAPYFGLDRDIGVTPQTRILRRGVEVEYLAGTDEVLLRAGDLVSGHAARLDRSQAVRRFYHLMLDEPDCLRVGRCLIETATLSEVVASQDATGRSHSLDARDCRSSLPLLDRPATRSLLGTAASGHGTMF